MSILNATQKQRIDIIEVLLTLGANPNEEDLNAYTPLLHAIIYRYSYIVRLLLQRGACPKKVNKYGNNPLHYAAAGGNLGSDEVIIKCLIDSGANPNCTNGLGETPLHLAATFGKVNAVKILLQRGADKCKTNEDGETPFSIAQERGHQDVVNILQL